MTATRASGVLLVLISAILCGCGETYTLPEDEWVLIESVEPPIYVRFTGKMAGSDPEYLFQSAERPVAGPITSPVPAKYALGRARVGETAILGQTTVQFDAYQRPSGRVRNEYVRFEVVAFDESENAVRIRVVSPPAENE
jgi:hypothetical protein